MYTISDDKSNQTESVTGNEDLHEQENLPFSSRKYSNSRSGRAETKAAWSDEYGESGSIKENLLQKPIICSCCRKRNEAAKANEPANVFKTADQCSAGDTLDIVPSKEYNEIPKKGDPPKSEQLDKYDISLVLLADAILYPSHPRVATDVVIQILNDKRAIKEISDCRSPSEFIPRTVDSQG